MLLSINQNRIVHDNTHDLLTLSGRGSVHLLLHGHPQAGVMPNVIFAGTIFLRSFWVREIDSSRATLGFPGIQVYLASRQIAIWAPGYAALV